MINKNIFDNTYIHIYICMICIYIYDIYIYTLNVEAYKIVLRGKTIFGNQRRKTVLHAMIQLPSFGSIDGFSPISMVFIHHEDYVNLGNVFFI